MSRILDSMKKRVVKLDAKIAPLMAERNALEKAIMSLTSTPDESSSQATLPQGETPAAPSRTLKDLLTKHTERPSGDA